MGQAPEIESLNNNSTFTEISQAVRSARESRNWSVQKLANLSGCETMLIEVIESGSADFMLHEAQNLLRILNIKFSIGIQ